MFFRVVCYGCAAVCGTVAIWFVAHSQPLPAALCAGCALWNYFIGGMRK